MVKSEHAYYVRRSRLLSNPVTNRDFSGAYDVHSYSYCVGACCELCYSSMYIE